MKRRVRVFQVATGNVGTEMIGLIMERRPTVAGLRGQL